MIRERTPRPLALVLTVSLLCLPCVATYAAPADASSLHLLDRLDTWWNRMTDGFAKAWTDAQEAAPFIDPNGGDDSPGAYPPGDGGTYTTGEGEEGETAPYIDPNG